MNRYQEDETKKKQHQQIRLANILLGTLENMLNRQENVKNPVVRYTLMVDKMCIITNLIISSLQTFIIDDSDPTSDINSRITNIEEKLNKEFNNLIDYIQQPDYAPDSAFGHKLMEQASENFNQLTK